MRMTQARKEASWVLAERIVMFICDILHRRFILKTKFSWLLKADLIKLFGKRKGSIF